jgi:phospholipid/cholesterol/gamma-HCH transport system ATP-binding protein
MIHAAENKSVIEIMNLNKSFGDNHVLRNFEMKLNKQQNLAVLGKSGSGKSVLIKCIIGLMEPDSGTIKVFEKNIPDLNHDELDRIRVRVGFLFQSNALYDSMTVRENLEFPLRRHWMKKETRNMNELVMEALENVGLPETVDRMPAELSGGMKKRISLARTLILKPEIILYDEPTTGLDPITAREISKLILKVQETYNASALIISHDTNCVKLVADEVIMLIDGKNYAKGSYTDMKNHSDEKVKQFFE